MQTINDLSSSQICTLAIYQSCFTDEATPTHNRQGEVTSRPDCVERWAQAPTKAHRESVLSLLLWLLLLHSSTTCSCFLLRWLCLLQLCWKREQSPSPAQAFPHFHSVSFSLPLKQYKSHMDVLCQHTCACAVGRAKGIFVSLLFASFSSFFFFVFNLNKVCSGPHLRDFLTPFQKLMSLLSLSCN